MKDKSIPIQILSEIVLAELFSSQMSRGSRLSSKSSSSSCDNDLGDSCSEEVAIMEQFLKWSWVIDVTLVLGWVKIEKHKELWMLSLVSRSSLDDYIECQDCCSQLKCNERFKDDHKSQVFFEQSCEKQPISVCRRRRAFYFPKSSTAIDSSPPPRWFPLEKAKRGLLPHTP